MLTHAPARPRAPSPAHVGDGSGAAICSSGNNGGISPAYSAYRLPPAKSAGCYGFGLAARICYRL